jgi:hypothetical protein
MLRDAASLMMTAPEIKDLGAFTVYGEGLSQLAGPFADLIAALGGRSGGTDSRSDPAESYDQCRTVSGLVVGQVARGFFFGIGAAIPRPANVCPPSCPRQGCTRHCYDEYSSPVGCGTWVRVPQGFFTAGGWSITCTWTIDSIVKDVCCCYPTYWHQFWAYGACTDCTVTIASTGTRAGTYTWVSHTRTAPAAPPNAFKVMLAC